MKRKLNSGITQLELLLSLAIMGLIAVFLANVLDFNRQGLDRTRNIAAQTEFLLAQDTLRRWIEAIPTDYSGGNASDFFRGDQNSLEFKLSQGSNPFSADEPVEFKLSVSEGDPPLLELVALGVHSETGKALEIRRVIAENVTNVQFGYFGARENNPESRWNGSWDDERYFPDLVKLEWDSGQNPAPPLTAIPAQAERYRFMSRSSLVPPG